MATAEGDADWSLPSPTDLDDNGFPDLPCSPAASSSCFAEDFYSSGTDWSSLRAPPPLRPPGRAPGVKEKEMGGGSLVQSSLLQAWGIEKPRREAGDSSLVQRSLFQAWGIERPPREGLGAGHSSPSPSRSGSWLGRKRRRGSTEEERVAPKKPLACPFYKKIPGKGRCVSCLDTKLVPN
jgi:DNA cross-link repair 1A protein